MVSKNLKNLIAGLAISSAILLGASAIYNKGVKDGYDKGSFIGSQEGLRRGLISGETSMFISAMNYYDKDYVLNNEVQYIGIEPHARRIEAIIENLESKNMCRLDMYKKVRKKLSEK